MWAMDSASLSSGESIITEDAMRDKEQRQRGSAEIQWKERGCEHRHAADGLCCRFCLCHVGWVIRRGGGLVLYPLVLWFDEPLVGSKKNMSFQEEVWHFSSKLEKPTVHVGVVVGDGKQMRCVCVCVYFGYRISPRGAIMLDFLSAWIFRSSAIRLKYLSRVVIYCWNPTSKSGEAGI